MFKSIMGLLCLLILQACNCSDGNSQTAATPLHNTSKNQIRIFKKTLMNYPNQNLMTCKLTSPELQKRKATVISEIKKLIKEKTELANGYAYRFDGTDKNVDFLIDFIKTERQCCDFFNFSIDVNNDKTTWLKITGAKGVKGFITSELEL